MWRNCCWFSTEWWIQKWNPVEHVHLCASSQRRWSLTRSYWFGKKICCGEIWITPRSFRWNYSDLFDVICGMLSGTKGSPMKSLKNGHNFYQASRHPGMLMITCSCWAVASHLTCWKWRWWLTRIVCWIKLQTEVGNRVTTLGSIWLANSWVMIADSAHLQSMSWHSQ